MIRREPPSSEYHDLVTGLCERLNRPGLDAAAKEDILRQLESVLAQRMKYLKTGAAAVWLPGQTLFQLPHKETPVNKGA